MLLACSYLFILELNYRSILFTSANILIFYDSQSIFLPFLLFFKSSLGGSNNSAYYLFESPAARNLSNLLKSFKYLILSVRFVQICRTSARQGRPRFIHCSHLRCPYIRKQLFHQPFPGRDYPSSVVIKTGSKGTNYLMNLQIFLRFHLID